jgi:uncharacterized membrane protein YraQ (UPF0718 family)
MNSTNKFKKISGSWYFLISITIIYGLFLIFRSDIFFKSLSFFNEIIIKIIPIFILIFVLMAISNYFITPKFVMKHLKDKGIKKWFFVIIGGILSTGPTYMWYPLLSDLKEKGLSYGLIACFLYNRSIKIPVLPVAILYFSWQYILVLCFVMVFVSIIQGLIINKLMEANKNGI